MNRQQAKVALPVLAVAALAGAGIWYETSRRNHQEPGTLAGNGTVKATQVELATLDKRLADMKRRVDAGTVSAKELQELQAQYQLLTLRYQQQLKDPDASEAASSEGRALTERMIKSVETEIVLIQQRIALLDKQVEAGTASSASAELLQLRRDLLGLQRRLDELKVGIRR